MIASGMRGNTMRRLSSSAPMLLTLAIAFSLANRPVTAQAPSAQTPAATTPAAAAWENPANWRSVKPVETDNIVYATVPHITNPSAEASSNPGTPNGLRPTPPNTGPAGTLDMHLDVYQVPSDKPTPVVLQLHGGRWIRRAPPVAPAP